MVARPGRQTSAEPATATVAGAAAALARIPLFAGLSGRQRTKVARLGLVQRFPAASRIVSKGSEGISAYIVLEGRCEVDRGRGRPRRAVGPGTIVGEMALLDGSPRSATVVASTEVTALCLGRRGFVKLLRDEPSVALAVITALGRRLRDAESEPPSIA
jgi:CRP-like cAMP-binding protein